MTARGSIAGLITGLAFAAFLVAPQAAGASSLQLSSQFMFYFAAPGETNDVSVTLSGTDYVLSDPGAVITPMAGCTAITVNQAKCPVATVGVIDIRLGDLDDEAAVDPSIAGLGDQFNPGVLIQGDAGNDTLTGGPNVDNGLYGHNNFSFEGPGEDKLTGGGLRDYLSGSEGNDELTGSAGRDDLWGGDGADNVDGGAGDDTLYEGTASNGADRLIPGPGIDQLYYGDRKGDVNVAENGLADDGELLEGDNVDPGLESVVTGSGNDTFAGSGEGTLVSTNEGNDTISAGDGDDQIEGGEGNDVLNGEGGGDQIVADEGNDLVDGGPGDDSISDGFELTDGGADSFMGGAGNDRLTYDTEEPLTIDLDGVADDGRPGEGDNAGVDLEDLEGGPAADDLTGNDSANQIEGGDGSDTISGRGGPDALLGEDGNDRIDGGAGVDEIDGAGGNDALRSRDSSPDEVNCGSAGDTLLADSLDDFTVTCDLSSTGAQLTSSGAKVKRGKASVKVLCPVVEGSDCRVTVTATRGKKALARGSGKVKSGKTGNVKLRLTGAGRKARSKKLVLKARTVLIDATGAKVATTRPRLVLTR
jgi:Ca2+-binding RTX toxin-like protein